MEIIPLDDPLKRDFYAEMCRMERWSVRTLRKKIDGMLFERTALSKKPEQLIRRELDALREEDRLTPDLVFRDPYLLGFLGLRDTYAEKDLEAAILREMEAFAWVLAELQADRKGPNEVRPRRQQRSRTRNDPEPAYCDMSVRVAMLKESP